MTNLDPAAPAPAPGPAPVDPAPAPAPTPVVSDAESIAALRARLDAIESRANARPDSTREQLISDLQAALGLRSDAATAKATARDVTNATDEAVHQLGDQIRLRDLRDEARAAGFRDPDFAAASLMSADKTADPKTLIASLAAAQPYMVTKVTDPDLTGSAATGITDPGLAAFVKQIEASRRT